MTIPSWIKPAAWGAVCGAAAITIFTMSAGWLVTSGAAEEQAANEADRAVIAALTPICVARFNKVAETQQEKYIAALEQESSWSQGDWIEEKGWATLPGSDEPNDEVAEACAEQLLAAAES